jgi:Helix-turn-helix
MDTLCGCGCGLTTNPSPQKKKAYSKGQPQRFIEGHYVRFLNQQKFPDEFEGFKIPRPTFKDAQGRTIRTRWYIHYTSMKARCLNPNAFGGKAKKYYVDKGIKICERWLSQPAAFFVDMVASKGLSDVPPRAFLDREDGNKDYCPENCRWITAGESSRNRSTIKLNMEKAREIRRLAGKYTQGQLAAMFGTSQPVISEIINGKRWMELPGFPRA